MDIREKFLNLEITLEDYYKCLSFNNSNKVRNYLNKKYPQTVPEYIDFQNKDGNLCLTYHSKYRKTEEVTLKLEDKAQKEKFIDAIKNPQEKIEIYYLREKNYQSKDFIEIINIWKHQYEDDKKINKLLAENYYLQDEDIERALKLHQKLEKENRYKDYSYKEELESYGGIQLNNNGYEKNIDSIISTLLKKSKVRFPSTRTFDYKINIKSNKEQIKYSAAKNYIIEIEAEAKTFNKKLIYNNILVNPSLKRFSFKLSLLSKIDQLIKQLVRFFEKNNFEPNSWYCGNNNMCVSMKEDYLKYFLLNPKYSKFKIKFYINKDNLDKFNEIFNQFETNRINLYIQTKDRLYNNETFAIEYMFGLDETKKLKNILREELKFKRKN